MADLEALGLLEKVEDREIELAHSDRTKTPIEPYLADQWFVKMDELAQSAMDAVTDGRVKIVPAALRPRLSRLAQRKTRLAHQPAALVGTSDSGLVRADRQRSAICKQAFAGRDDVVWQRDDEHDQLADLRAKKSTWPKTPMPGHKLDAGVRRPRHLVQLRPLAALDARLAGQDAGAATTTIRPARWSPAATSSRCGSRGWC